MEAVFKLLPIQLLLLTGVAGNLTFEVDISNECGNTMMKLPIVSLSIFMRDNLVDSRDSKSYKTVILALMLDGRKF